MVRLLKWVVKIALVAVAILLVMALGVLLFVGLTPVGSQIAAERISSIVSTPDRQVNFSPPQGLLSGDLQIASLTLSDDEGTYAEIEGLHVDWSPTALLRGVFRAENVSVDSIDVLRAPLPSALPDEPQAGQSSGFSLPVGVRIAQIDMPDIEIAPALTGRPFSLSLQGSIDATGPNIRLDLEATRQDEPDARAVADILYAPAENRLAVTASVSEPQGGLLARLLKLPGAPAVDLALEGTGPLSDWSGKLSGSVAGDPVVAAEGSHQMLPDGSRRVELVGGGQLATLLPPAFRPLFEGTTDIDVAANIGRNGRISIDNGKIVSGAVNITASGVWDPAGDNSLTASLTGTDGPVPIVWPIAGYNSRFVVDTLNLTVTGAAQSARLNATAALASADVAQGRFGQIRLQAESEDLNLVTRSGSVRSRLTIGESDFSNADLDRALQAPITLDAPLRLDLPAIGLDAATLDSARLSGTVSGTYNTTSQNLTGNFRITATPEALPPAFASRFENTILAEGYVERTSANQVKVENFVLKSDAVEAHGNATLAGEQMTGRLAGRVPELRRWLANAEGAAGFDVSAEGRLDALWVKGVVNAAEIRLAGKLVQDLRVNVEGVANPQSPAGKVEATGSIEGQPLSINADLRSEGGRTSAPAIDLQVGPNRLEGALSFSPDFMPEGNLEFEFPDVSLLAALAAQQAEGDLQGTVAFENRDGQTQAVVRASGSRVASGNLEVTGPVIDVTVPDLRALAADGTIRASRLGTAATAIEALDLNFAYQDTGTRLELDARYDDAPLTGVATVRTGDTTSVALESFAAEPRGISVQLANPTTIVVADGNARLSDLTVGTGDGRISVSGTVGSQLDVQAQIESLPASLLNTFVPALNAAGSISGTIDAEGSLTAPSIRYDLEWSEAQLQQTRQAGVGPLQLQVAGSFSDRTLQLDETQLSGADGLDIDASGRIVLNEDGPPALDINATANAVPASLANAFVPGLGARGTIAGTVTAAGTPQAPAVRYDLTWSDAAVAQTTSAGLSSLQVRATGEYRDNAVTIETSLAGQGNLSLSGGGTISLQGARALDLQFDGQVPFAILAGQLADQGFVLEGTGSVDLAIGGTTVSPSITGSASTSGARLIDVRRNLAVEQLAANVTFTGTEANISSLTGRLSTGGRVSASGSIGIIPGSGFPADLSISLVDATYVDGTLFTATASGDLTVTGPLTAGPVLGGRITLSEAAITVPAKLPTSLTEIEIRHRNPPPEVVRQVRELAPEQASGTSSPLALDLQISAPSGIFVRGRGIDAELGGELAITGTAAAPQVAGGFEMRRGRIIILTKRLDFTSGEITFGGGLIPVLDLEATTTSAQTTITVTVTGIANDPDISFSSSPALPQDEVLARLIFGQSMSRLSPLQIAQLADAVGQLAGGGSTSLLETLRSNLGVDDLDINTDETGQTTVSVGRYLNNRTYLQLEQGGAEGARATINLDVGRGVKLKAGAGTEGGTAGIFYEREY